MKFKITYLFYIILLCYSLDTICQNNSFKIALITSKNTFEAGETITLKFSTKDTKNPMLYCSNSYGSTLINGHLKNNIIEYNIPENIAKKSGLVSWRLLDNNVSGKFNIIPKNEVTTMESYLGPPSILAGGKEYTMLVVIPTDGLDNPTKDSTVVDIKHQFLKTETKTNVFTKNLISFKNIFSPKKTGRMLISSESMGTNSKEFDVNIMPEIPTNFTISFKRPHNYADGNQITTFSTSLIKDKYSNVVADGTHVEFFITTKSGAILKTSGNTVNGIAYAKMIHPDHESYWSVKAAVIGMAKSNSINIEYASVIKNFNVSFSKNNRNIVVGPLQSFMKQHIPNGLQVSLLIYKKEKHITTIVKYSNVGFVNFKLKNDIYKNSNYTFIVKTAGIEKIFKNIKLN